MAVGCGRNWIAWQTQVKRSKTLLKRTMAWHLQGDLTVTPLLWHGVGVFVFIANVQWTLVHVEPKVHGKPAFRIFCNGCEVRGVEFVHRADHDLTEIQMELPHCLFRLSF